jgi:tetraacyldisaccharide 4'-kinase
MKGAWPAFWLSGQQPPWWAKGLSGLFCTLVRLRRWLYAQGWLRQQRLSVPVIVVGNRVVGGSGKTPVILALVPRLQAAGLRVGVISRGYARQDQQMRRVDAASTATLVGDEPLLLWQQLQVPIAVGADRAAVGAWLLSQVELDVMVSDDGWQHYRLARNWMIEVMDGARGYGNGYCLPAGPLREKPDMLPLPDLKLVQGQDFFLQPVQLRQLMTGECFAVKTLSTWSGVRAIAGIGHPQRFFDSLLSLGATLIESYPLADHQALTANDFHWDDARYPVLMTAKDGVRCQAFAKPHWWVLDVAVQFSDDRLNNFVQDVCKKIRKKHG